VSAIEIPLIGHVRGGRDAPDDDDWGKSRARIELDAGRFKPEALAGLSDFSHAEVVFVFDSVSGEEITTGARHPRGRADWPKIGIFAQCAKNRASRIGASICRIITVDALAIEVGGLDAVRGTPVLDIKPVMTGFLPRGEIREPDWARDIMATYW
jgi:tRNA (Thr-GGU) A37 N-methylase